MFCIFPLVEPAVCIYWRVPSHDQPRCASDHGPAWILGEPSHFWSIHMLDHQPVWSLSCPPPYLPLLFISCLATRIKYRPTLSKLSILSIQSLSVFSATFSLALLCPLLFLLPFANSPWRGLLGFSMKKWKTFLEQHKLLLSEAISTMNHLMTQWKVLLGGDVHPRIAQGARSAHCSFIHVGAPTRSEGSPSVFESPGSGCRGSYKPRFRRSQWVFLVFPSRVSG